MPQLSTLIRGAIDLKCSDIHLTAKLAPSARVLGELQPLDPAPLTAEQTYDFLKQLVGAEQLAEFNTCGDLDAAVMAEGERFRLNAYRQRGATAVAMRLINSKTPTLAALNLPPVVEELTHKARGLILVTGPTGSGKSTTLAAMINAINMERHAHILTLEDPIEYLHEHKKCMVNQREIGADSETYASALRAALREDPDVILVGEMRDPETIATALTAAETGHLVMSTLHTTGAAKTIDRVIDSFPPHQQQQVRAQISTSLQAVISQQLCPTMDGQGRVAALEIMLPSPAIRNLIRENKVPQINNAISTSMSQGMCSMDGSLAELARKRVISRDTAIQFCVDYDALMSKMR
ncbi:twitching motility protein [Clostridia bacterium]|nr:twitching motility protein [Clostridia bacterium]